MCTDFVREMDGACLLWIKMKKRSCRTAATAPATNSFHTGIEHENTKEEIRKEGKTHFLLGENS